MEACKGSSWRFDHIVLSEMLVDYVSAGELLLRLFLQELG